DQVKADVKVNPRAPGRRLAALIGGELPGFRIGRTEQAPEGQVESSQEEGQKSKDENVAEMEIHVPSPAYPLWVVAELREHGPRSGSARLSHMRLELLRPRRLSISSLPPVGKLLA